MLVLVLTVVELFRRVWVGGPVKAWVKAWVKGAVNRGDKGEIWGVVRALEDTFGWSEQDIRGFLGENLLRVYRANWQ